MNIKLYMVRFEEKNTKQVFYKFGITHHFDVLDRFKDDEYKPWNIKAMCSAYGPRHLVEEAERYLLQKYPKNLWIEQKISGVTEIVALSREQIVEAINIIKNYSNQWYSLRHESIHT